MRWPLNRGMNDQEGDLVPSTSVWGQEYLAHLPQYIDNPAPIGRQSHGWRGTVGGMATRSASVVALFAPGGYWGDLPSGEQAYVPAPQPWERT
jgi:hypothetical protein